MEKEKKKTIILSVVAVVTLALLVIGATYAYFTSQGGDPASANVSVTTYTTDVLTFATGDDISIYADQESFASGKGNATGSTYAKATLTANNKTNTATEHYYVYLNITNNDFVYTIDNSTPELILTVTDVSGNEITNISGLSHVSVTDGKGETVSGYDITTSTGLLTLFNNREITASPSKEEQWNIKLTLVNYDKDQTNNAAKSLSAKVIIQKDKIEFLNDHIISLYTGTQGENNIYYHNGNLETGIDDGSYRYAGASSSVNNYVCFGSDDETCPIENLYRIIGVIDGEVKLIKSTVATSALLGTDGDYNSEINSYYWNKNATTNGSTNTWSVSLLNIVNLNTNFTTNIGEEWAKKIATTTWKVGGNTLANIYSVVPSTVYQNEIVNPVTTNSMDNGKEYTAKIGLMYVSDYEFAASPTYWINVGYNSDSTKDYSAAKASNWMCIGSTEWTISRNASGSTHVFIVNWTGIVDRINVAVTLSVRPVFFLNSDVTYVSGDGTLENPIRLGD